jgi:hypothetical protein
MPSLVLIAIALIGAAIQVRRHRERASATFPVDTFLVWWLVAAIGVGGLIGAGYHLFDGRDIAEEIGYTRGNGGFQFENAMGDLAIGVAGVLCLRFRGFFWLAVLLITAIQYYGDAGGHIYYWIADDNTEPGNVGPPLWTDIILPTVGLILYFVSWKEGGDARPRYYVARRAV